MIQGGSDERRKFLDMIISQQDKNYLHALIQYNKALMQRNVLLKNQVTDYSLFEVLEMQMELYGSKIYKDRVRLVEELTPLFNSYYQTICSSSECVGLTYISQLSDCGWPNCFSNPAKGIVTSVTRRLVYIRMIWR